MRIAIAAALLCLAAPLAAQQHDMSHMKDEKSHAGMKMAQPAGWHLRTDDAKADSKAMMFHSMGKTLAFMTGPAGIAWNPANKARGSFMVSASFEQEKIPAHPEAYGLILNGSNLDKADQSYLYFLIRHDGKFLIKHRAGADTHDLVDWSSSPAIVKPDAKGNSKNVLAVDADKDKIRYLINGKQVAAFNRDRPRAADGLTGVRVNHNLEVHVDNFKVTRR